MRTVAQISDLHFGGHDARAVDALVTSLNQCRPDLVVVSGDFTQRARRAEFGEARAFLDRIASPKLVVPGNHDVPLYDVVGRFLSPFVKFNRYVSPAGLPNSLFVDDEIAVFGLNTARSLTQKNGRVSLLQVAQIRNVFAQIPPHVIKVLVTHHPLSSPIDAAPVALAGRSSLALEAIVSLRVHLLLSGHHHRSTSGAPAEINAGGSILVVHAGTATSTRTRGGEDNSYNLLAIEQGRLSLIILAWSGEDGFKEKARTAYSYNEHSWRREPPTVAV